MVVVEETVPGLAIGKSGTSTTGFRDKQGNTNKNDSHDNTLHEKQKVHLLSLVLANAKRRPGYKADGLSSRIESSLTRQRCEQFFGLVDESVLPARGVPPISPASTVPGPAAKIPPHIRERSGSSVPGLDLSKAMAPEPTAIPPAKDTSQSIGTSHPQIDHHSSSHTSIERTSAASNAQDAISSSTFSKELPHEGQAQKGTLNQHVAGHIPLNQRPSRQDTHSSAQTQMRRQTQSPLARRMRSPSGSPRRRKRPRYSHSPSPPPPYYRRSPPQRRYSPERTPRRRKYSERRRSPSPGYYRRSSRSLSPPSRGRPYTRSSLSSSPSPVRQIRKESFGYLSPRRPSPEPGLPVPGNWLVKVGAGEARVMEASFDLDEGTWHKWSLNGTSNPLTLRLLCLPTSAVTEAHQPLSTSLVDVTPEKLALVVSEVHVQWPTPGDLLIQINKDTSQEHTWFPLDLKSTTPLDLTPFVRRGRNDLRFIQLANLSEYTFIITAFPKQDRRVWSDREELDNYLDTVKRSEPARDTALPTS